MVTSLVAGMAAGQDTERDRDLEWGMDREMELNSILVPGSLLDMVRILEVVLGMDRLLSEGKKKVSENEIIGKGRSIGSGLGHYKGKGEGRSTGSGRGDSKGSGEGRGSKYSDGWGRAVGYGFGYGDGSACGYGKNENNGTGAGYSWGDGNERGNLQQNNQKIEPDL